MTKEILIRCKYFSRNGAPINGGCRDPNCRYIHPLQKQAWDNAQKVPIRCKLFNEDGEPLGGVGCRRREDCRFVHPDEPQWLSLVGGKQTDSPIGSLELGITEAPSPIEPKTLPAIVTNLSSFAEGEAQTSAIPQNTTVPESALWDQSKKISFLFKKMDASPAVESSVASVLTSTDAQSSDAATAKWRKIISTLTHAYVTHQELYDLENAVTDKLAFYRKHPRFQNSTRSEFDAGVSAKRKALKSKLSEHEKQLSALGFWSFGVRIARDDATKRVSDALPQIEGNVQRVQRLFDEVAKGLVEKINTERNVETVVDDDIKAAREVKGLLTEENITRIGELEKLVERVKTSESFKELADLVDDADELIEQEKLQRMSLKNKFNQFDEDLQCVCEESSRLLTEKILETRLGSIQQQTRSLHEDASKVVAEHQRLTAQQAQTSGKIKSLLEELEVLRRLLKPTHTISQDDRESLVKDITNDIQTVMGKVSAEGKAKIAENHSLLKMRVMAKLKPTMANVDAMKNVLEVYLPH